MLNIQLFLFLRMNILYSIIMVVCIIFTKICSCKDALQYFITHRKLINSTIILLNDFSGTNNKRWIEYTYYLNNNHTKLSHGNQECRRKTLKVGIFLQNNNSFDCAYKYKQDMNTTSLQGYSVDVLENLGNLLNFSTDYVLAEDLENITKALLSKEIDIIICHLEIENDEIVKIYPTIKSRYVLVYKPSQLHFIKDIFVLTFAGSLWFVFLITLIILAVCLRISTLRYSIIYSDHEPWTWVDITLWAIAAACQQGLSNTPKGFSSCCIFLLGYITAYLSYTGFTAAITSLLVQHGNSYTIDVTSPKIMNFRLISLSQTKSETTSIIKKFAVIEYVEDMERLFRNLDRYGNVGIAPEILVNDYISHTYNYMDQINYKMTKLNDVYYRRGFYVLINNPLRKQINEKILELDVAGVLNNILREHIKYSYTSQIDSGYSSAGQEHVGSAIFVLLAGILASIFFLIVELGVAFYKKYHNKIKF